MTRGACIINRKCFTITSISELCSNFRWKVLKEKIIWPQGRAPGRSQSSSSPSSWRADTSETSFSKRHHQILLGIAAISYFYDFRYRDLYWALSYCKINYIRCRRELAQVIETALLLLVIFVERCDLSAVIFVERCDLLSGACTRSEPAIILSEFMAGGTAISKLLRQICLFIGAGLYSCGVKYRDSYRALSYCKIN